MDHLISRIDGKSLIMLNCCDECTAQFDDLEIPLCEECSFKVEALVRLCHSRPLFAIEFEEGSME